MTPLPSAGTALVLMLAFALAAIGWGHRLPDRPPDRQDLAASQRLAAFQSVGGDAMLCGTPARPASQAPCDACILTSGADLPPVSTAFVAPRMPDGRLPAGGATRVAAIDCHPGWHGRAPPRA